MSPFSSASRNSACVDRLFDSLSAMLARGQDCVHILCTGSKELYRTVGYFSARDVSLPEGSQGGDLPLVSSV